MATPDIDGDDFDAQDVAESFDETHNVDEMLAPDETRSFEGDLLDDVYDATAAYGDADDDDEALDAADYDADELDPDDIDEEDDEDDPLVLRDELEDVADDISDEDDADEDDNAPMSAAADDDVEVEFVDSLDDADGTHDRLARRYEASGELSDDDVEELGYAMDNQPNNEPRDHQKPAQGSGAHADDVADESNPKQEDLLDEGIEETFPASDPVSVKHIT